MRKYHKEKTNEETKNKRKIRNRRVTKEQFD